MIAKNLPYFLLVLFALGLLLGSSSLGIGTWELNRTIGWGRDVANWLWWIIFDGNFFSLIYILVYWILIKRKFQLHKQLSILHLILATFILFSQTGLYHPIFQTFLEGFTFLLFILHLFFVFRHHSKKPY